MAEILSEKVRCSSKMKLRLRSELVVLSEELCILSSYFLSPMSTNSVLEELRVRSLAVIQEEICWRAFCRWVMIESKLAGKMRETVGCRLHKGDGSGTGRRWEYWGGSVHGEKQRTENGALGNTTAGGIEGEESVIKSDTVGARWQVRLKPVEDRAMDAEPRWVAGE